MFLRFILIISFAVFVSGLDKDGNWNTKADTCTKPGTQCSSDCEDIIYCAGSSGEPIILDHCPSHGDKFLCTQTSSNNFVCAEGAVCNGNEDDYPVTCGGGGHFPGAYNCSISYFCTKAGEKPVYECLCPPGSHFESGTCTTVGYEACCDDPAARAQCNSIGQFGTFGSCHPGYYYICGLSADGHLVANVLRCELGETFVDGSCQASKDIYKENGHNFLPKIDFLSCGPYVDNATTKSTADSTTEATTESTPESTTQPLNRFRTN